MLDQDTLKKWVNNFLIADLFLVMFGFFWFVFAVTVAYAGVTSPYKLWSQLWMPLFQPALGILMLGALASGVWSWIQRQLNARQPK